jgi:Ca2+/H+ antiporter
MGWYSSYGILVVVVVVVVVVAEVYAQALRALHEDGRKSREFVGG